MLKRSVKLRLRRILTNGNLWTFVGIVVIINIIVIRCFLGHHRKSEQVIPEIPAEPSNNEKAPWHNERFETPAKYNSKDLHEWHHPPLVVAKDPMGFGEMGHGVHFPKKNADLEEVRFKEHEFNIMASEAISLNRSLPEYRKEACRKIVYPRLLPDTSIIIIFHNEAWSTLLRTVWSICNRSPRELVREIILVDDASEHKELGTDLDNYMKNFPIKTVVLRQRPRAGLIKARLMGADYAQGQVLTFLDAHCECTDGWLEPLLARVAHNRYIVPSPTIAIIDDHTFKFLQASCDNYGAFGTSLGFKWIPVPKREWDRVDPEKTEPLRQPAMAGGLFSIDRAFFFEIGSFDEGMKIWGGENIEISFRIWTCGGSLEILPCSHVGHVFRKHTAYKFPEGSGLTVSYNTVRLVKVWLDEFENLYFQMNPGSLMVYDSHGDISKRKELRKRFQCKSFRWYLNNVYPEHELPESTSHLGALRNVDTDECLDTMGSNNKLELQPCHNLGGNQLWVLTKLNEIKNDEDCLDGVKMSGEVEVAKCHGQQGNQRWTYDELTKILRHESGQCLSRPTVHSKIAIIRDCDGSVGQQWLLERVGNITKELVEQYVKD